MEIVYLDASALVKRYIKENGTEEVQELLRKASVVGTASITQVEVAAALAKATRMGLLTQGKALTALEAFREDWRYLERLQVTGLVLSRAAELAWEKGLRAYDATHLAAALIWREMLGKPITMATFDRELWDASRTYGLVPWPGKL